MEKEFYTQDEVEKLMDSWILKQENFKKNHPILFKIQGLWLQIKNGDPLWWFKYRFVKKHQYHIVHTGLKPGYHDARTKILYGIFAEFANWAETDRHYEGPIVMSNSKQFDDPDYREYYLLKKEMFDDLQEAYAWWIKIGRDPERYLESFRFSYDNEKVTYNYDKEVEFNEECSKMAGKIIKHLFELWN